MSTETYPVLPDYLEKMRDFYEEDSDIFRGFEGPYSLPEIEGHLEAEEFIGVLSHEENLYDDQGNIFVPAEYAEKLLDGVERVDEAAILEEPFVAEEEPPELMDSKRNWGRAKNTLYGVGYVTSSSSGAIGGALSYAKVLDYFDLESLLFAPGIIPSMFVPMALTGFTYIASVEIYEERKKERNFQRTGEYLSSELEGHRVYVAEAGNLGLLKSNGKIQEEHPEIEAAVENLENQYPNLGL
jgi:hypothetical protein